MNLLPGVRTQMLDTDRLFEGSRHAPLFDAADPWKAMFFDFLASV